MTIDDDDKLTTMVIINQSINQYKIAYTKPWSALHTKYQVYKIANKTE